MKICKLSGKTRQYKSDKRVISYSYCILTFSHHIIYRDIFRQWPRIITVGVVIFEKKIKTGF